MSRTTHETKSSIWKRLFVERSHPREFVPDPRPVFLASGVAALAAGVLGWALAAVLPQWPVPVCTVVAILGGLLGVRSRLHTVSLIGFVMGMFLLPNAVNIVIRLFSTATR